MYHRWLDTGGGSVALLLHGTGPGAEQFSSLVEALRGHHRVLAPNLPGYSGTPGLVDQDLIERGSELLLADLSELSVRECAIVGVSGGAYRALRLALAPDLRVPTVISLGGFANLPPEHRSGLRELSGALRANADVCGLLTTLMLSPERASKPASRAWVEAWLGATPALTLADELEAFAGTPDLLPRLAGLRSRLLARVGEFDAAVPKERSQEMVAAARHAELFEVANVGHSQLFEDERAVIDFICQALQH